MKVEGGGFMCGGKQRGGGEDGVIEEGGEE